MTLLDLAQDLGLNTKKTSHSKGGEFHSACPACGEGVDRFVIWPEANQYWCRRCGVGGDAIQFCRDFMNMSFHEARRKLNDTSRLHSQCQLKKRPAYERLSVVQDPPKIWQNKALIFVEWSHKQLERTPAIMKELCERGFQDRTIGQYKLGYAINLFSSNSQDFFRERSEWGLPCEYKSGGNAKKLWLPAGLVIPTMSKDGSVYKLKIRRREWYPDDPLPKYVEISGSKLCPSIYGDPANQVAMVLESELDAMLIQQEAKDLCFCIALGGVTKKPDALTNRLLNESKLILWSLDNDEAGRKAALWWRESYPHLKFWPVSIGKSPGDAFKDHGVNLRDWILRGLQYHNAVVS